MNKSGLLHEDDGAKVIDVKENDDKIEIPPCLIQKSDGAYLYATSDLGTIYQREQDYHPDAILYVVDGRQSMHFTQIFRVARKTNIYNGILEHHGFGTVNGTDNKPFKTRTGGALKLKDLIIKVKEQFINLREENKNMDEEDLNKIVNAIIKFADLQNNLERDYIFDIKKFSEVNGKTGPYILYTYLRINKIISKTDAKLSNNIYDETDRTLRLKMLEVSKVIDLAANERRPHYIADYLYELSVVANNFYQKNKMSDIDGIKKTDFEIVLGFNNYIIKTLLGLLGIKIPKVM
jgi:arginyl-tRNA synthetase